ncbi:MAG: DUF4426 domain-containing protein [Woeseiaceae bacterium]|nr:DUF4426 domain-containing protein [Woeseiaceae bacterium]
MRITKTIFVLSWLAMLAACGRPEPDATVPEAEPAGATSVDIGQHVVHFSAQSTDQLPPEVARAYNFVRSKNRAMLTVSVVDERTNKPTAAEVTVETRNLAGQLKNVAMRTITEGDSIYYIGETPVANREILIFDISVTPDGAERPVDVRFKREFFTN